MERKFQRIPHNNLKIMDNFGHGNCNDPITHAQFAIIVCIPASLFGFMQAGMRDNDETLCQAIPINGIILRYQCSEL